MSQLPERDGKFRGYPIEWGVEPSAKTQSIAFACRWRLTEWHDPVGKAWHPYHHMDREITSRTYFVKADGTPSPTGVDQLRTALGWDGVNVLALQDTDWTQRGCSLQVDWDEYQGTQKLKVTWLDSWEGNGSFGGGGGIKRADAAALQAFQNRLGAQLRATSPKPSGGPPPPPAATAGPRVPAGGPPPPPPAKAANPIPPGPPATPGDMDEDSIPF